MQDDGKHAGERQPDEKTLSVPAAGKGLLDDL